MSGLGALFRSCASRLAVSAPVKRPPLGHVRVGWATSGVRAVSTQPDLLGTNSKVCTVLGAQWGDEGKGKLVDILAKRYDLIARFNGGANAGHTLVVDGKKFAFHLLPCGMLYPDKINVIGNGVVLHVPTMLQELSQLTAAGIATDGRLKISNRAHLLFEAHKMIDGLQEHALGGSNIGTTKKGIGPCYASKATRNGLRAGDLLDFALFKQKHTKLISALQSQYKFDYDIAKEQASYEELREIIKDNIIDTAFFLNSQLAQGKTVLAEGANAALLDLDHGTYPFVTSSSTTAAGVCTGLGIAPSRVNTAIGVVKAYTTRVGSGPFPTELLDSVGDALRAEGHEFGTTTGRPRRCGWLDIPVLQYSHMLNNYTSINITKLDVLSKLETIKIGTHYTLNGKTLPAGLMPSSLEELGSVQVHYESMKGWQCDISKARAFEELPKEAQAYLNRVEELVGVPVSWVGVGAARADMATKGGKANL